MTNVRTDIHRPSAIQPQDYNFLGIHFDPGVEDVVGGDYLMCEENRRIRGFMEEKGAKWAQHEHGGTCFCCGAHAVYLAVFYHAPSNECIMVGERCADKLEMGEAESFARARKTVAAERKAIAGKRKAQEALSSLGLTAAWDIFTANGGQRLQEESTVRDMVSRLVQYGTLSDKQIEFMKTLLHRIENREQIKAQRELEKEQAAPCPAGRLTVTGTVLSVKWSDGVYGRVLKMFVKASEGYTLYGTVPSGVEVERGSQVTFKATITPASNDPKHGFFSRPSAQK